MSPPRLLAQLLVCAGLVFGLAHDAASSEHQHASHVARLRAGQRGDFVVGGAAKVSFARDVAPVLRRHCAECHVGSCASGLAFFDAAGNPQHAVVGRHVGQILLELQTGRMPAGRPYAVPSDQFKLIDVWGASGAPDN